jgi:hypothetical protein
MYQQGRYLLPVKLDCSLKTDQYTITHNQGTLTLLPISYLLASKTFAVVTVL